MTAQISEEIVNQRIRGIRRGYPIGGVENFTISLPFGGIFSGGQELEDEFRHFNPTRLPLNKTVGEDKASPPRLSRSGHRKESERHRANP